MPLVSDEKAVSEGPGVVPQDVIPQEQAQKRLVVQHLLWGWSGLSLVVVLGVMLETFHAFKLPFYLHVDSETRRLLFRLAHAHAGLLCLLELGFAFTLTHVSTTRTPRPWRRASRALHAATILLPLGLFLGGVGLVGQRLDKL